MALHMPAAMLPIPYAVQPLAAMIAAAAPRVWSAISCLKEAVRVPGGRHCASGVHPTVIVDHAT
jgi:hypothetical protein